MDVEDRAELNTRVIIRPDVPKSLECLPHQANALRLTTLQKVADRYGVKVAKIRYWMKAADDAPEQKGYLVNGTGACPYLYDAKELVLFVEKKLNTQFMRDMLCKK